MFTAYHFIFFLKDTNCFILVYQRADKGGIKLKALLNKLTDCFGEQEPIYTKFQELIK